MAFPVQIADLAQSSTAAAQAQFAPAQQAANVGLTQAQAGLTQAQVGVQHQTEIGKHLENQQTMLALQDQAGLNKALGEAALAARTPPAPPQGAPVQAPPDPEGGISADPTAGTPTPADQAAADQAAAAQGPAGPGTPTPMPAPAEPHEEVHKAIANSAIVNGMPNAYSDAFINDVAKRMEQNGVRPTAIQAFVSSRITARTDLAKNLQEISSKGTDQAVKVRDLSNNNANDALTKLESNPNDAEARHDLMTLTGGLDPLTPEGFARAQSMRENSPDFQRNETNRISNMEKEVKTALDKTKVPDDEHNPLPPGYVRVDVSPAERIKAKTDLVTTQYSITNLKKMQDSRMKIEQKFPFDPTDSKWGANINKWMTEHSNDPDVREYKNARSSVIETIARLNVGNQTDSDRKNTADTLSDLTVPPSAQTAIIQKQLGYFRQAEEGQLDTMMRRQKIPSALPTGPAGDVPTPVSKPGAQLVLGKPTVPGAQPDTQQRQSGMIGPAPTTWSKAQIQEVSKQSGKTEAEIMAAIKAKGGSVQ